MALECYPASSGPLIENNDHLPERQYLTSRIGSTAAWAEAHSAFWKILVPSDGLKYFNEALNHTVNIGKKYGSKLTLLHVVISQLYAYSE